MLSGLLAAHMLTFAAPPAEVISQPVLRRADVADEARRQIPDRIVEHAADGTYYVLRTSQQQSGNWPTVYVDYYDSWGTKQWTHYHEIPRAGSGLGFDELLGATTDKSGNLVFAFHSAMHSHHNHLVKLGKNRAVVWQVELAGGPRNIVAVPESDDVVLVSGRHGDIYVERRTGSDGSQIWQTHDDTAQTERNLVARIDGVGNIVVVSDYGVNLRRDAKVTKFDAQGTRLWGRTHSLPATWYNGGIPTVINAFIAKDNGIMAAYRVTSEKKLVVHRYSANGALQATRTIETNGYVSSQGDAIARYGFINGKESLVLAWDTNPATGAPGEEIGVIPILFKKTPVAAVSRRRRVASRGSKAKAKAGGPKKVPAPVKKYRWDASSFPEQRLTGTGEFLVGMDIGWNSRIYLATELRGAKGRVRISAMPGLPGGTRRTLDYAARERHARVVDMFCGKHKLMQVVGTLSNTKGRDTVLDIDVFRLQVWMKAPPKTSRTTPVSNKPYTNGKPRASAVPN